MERETVKTIAKKYGFQINCFVRWEDDNEFQTFFSRPKTKTTPSFMWIEDDWFESEEACEEYFKSWNEKLASRPKI
jgi:hypothetical protein